MPESKIDTREPFWAWAVINKDIQPEQSNNYTQVGKDYKPCQGPRGSFGLRIRLVPLFSCGGASGSPCKPKVSNPVSTSKYLPSYWTTPHLGLSSYAAKQPGFLTLIWAQQKKVKKWTSLL